MGYRPPSNEFNASATPSQEMLRRLMAMALSGNEALHSVFSAMADRAGNTERGRVAREKENERIASFMRTAMASQERVAEFQKKLDELERASYEALIENERQLTEAQEELARIREQAYEITLRDGSKAKVYRDGDKVRDDAGNEVSEDVVKPGDISDRMPDWSRRRAAGERVDELTHERQRIIEYRDRLEETREQAADGELPEDRLNDLEAGVDEMPASVRRHAGMPPEQEAEPLTRPAPGASMPAPM
jgi:hypothetical protein